VRGIVGTAEVDAVVAAHEGAVRRFTAGGIGSALLDRGPADAPAVVCVHGVPTSSYLYRKVVDELAARGLRGLAFDLPGLGLADRPEDYDYTWTGLGRFAAQAVDALGLDEFHLVVHDVGGPVGFELAAAMPDRVRSLTVLDTMVAVEHFTRPAVMEPFAHRGVGELWLGSMRPWMFPSLMRAIGVAKQDQVSDAELAAYIPLLRGDDGGRAFLKIMRGFQRTKEKGRLYRSVVGDERRPRQVIWGRRDPALRVGRLGKEVARLAGVELQTVNGKHFLQEDNAPAIADAVAQLVRSA
jgi:pimeloyl-ACP methyl ester carboxylesterase